MNQDEEKRISPERENLKRKSPRTPFSLASAISIFGCWPTVRCSHFHAGGIIFREGESANRFYLILRGKVGLESSTLGEPIQIEEIHDGDLLGWSWLFRPMPGISPRAREETDAIFFYGTILREYCEKDHSLGFELFKRMSVVMLRGYKRRVEINDRPAGWKLLTSSNSGSG
jgi:CRP-like cAMP-binding protein